LFSRGGGRKWLLASPRARKAPFLQDSVQEPGAGRCGARTPGHLIQRRWNFSGWVTPRAKLQARKKLRRKDKISAPCPESQKGKPGEGHQNELDSTYLPAYSLLGEWLFSLIFSSKPLRLQVPGAFLLDDQTHRLVFFLSLHQIPWPFSVPRAFY
jgi:hypothetical protein